MSFLCECGAPDCAERVHMRVSEYERIAGSGGYLIAPGHDAVWRGSPVA